MSVTLRCQGCGYHFGWDDGTDERAETCPDCGSVTVFEVCGLPGRREITACLVHEGEEVMRQRLIRMAAYDRLLRPNRHLDYLRC